MSTLFTPQKNFNQSTKPPKRSISKTTQKPGFSFENSQNSLICYNYSPRTSTPVNHKTLNRTVKTPLRSNNSSPAQRRSVEGLAHGCLEDAKKCQELIGKIEAEKERLRVENEVQAGLIAEMEVKCSENREKLKKKDEKIRFLALLLKETEIQFKSVLECTSKDLEKIIQEQAMKIKELNETLKTQQKDLSVKWEVEKQELAAQINLLEQINIEKLQSQALSFTEKIEELRFSVEKLECEKKSQENNTANYPPSFEEDSCSDLICSLGARVKNELFHLQKIIEGVCKNEDVSLSTILMTPLHESYSKIKVPDLPKLLQHCLLSLNTIRTHISDIYAERYGETCHIQ